MSEKDYKRYSAEELRIMARNGGTKTDDVALSAMTDGQIEASIAVDPAWKDVPSNWHDNAVPIFPGAKQLLSIRLDKAVVDWFREQGPGYQTRMNHVLRAYMKAKQAGGAG